MNQHCPNGSCLIGEDCWFLCKPGPVAVGLSIFQSCHLNTVQMHHRRLSFSNKSI